MSQSSFLPLRHEHIVRSNDPANSAGERLTRKQLWAALLHTIQTPQELDRSIDAAIVESVSARLLRRAIRRGSHVIADEVELSPDECLQVRADIQGILPAAL